jgi:hypothetical protein
VKEVEGGRGCAAQVEVENEVENEVEGERGCAAQVEVGVSLK